MEQYACDSWCKTESGRLNYCRNNYNKVRKATLCGLLDGINAGDYEDTGNNVILPSSFIESPRHFYNCYLNDMAIADAFGPPDIFATMTTNPNWPEVKRNIGKHQTHEDRPDILNRIYRIKNKIFRRDLKERGVFGKAAALCNGHEFQKRGPAHTHSLLTLIKSLKIRTSDDVDRFISARIPNPKTHPRLYKLVTTLMLHAR